MNTANSTKWLDTIAYLNKLLETQEDLLSINFDIQYHVKPWSRVARANVLLTSEAFEKRFLNSDVPITLDFAVTGYVRLNAFPAESSSIVYSGCCSTSHLMETWHDRLYASDDPGAQELLRSYPVAPDPAANVAQAETWAPGGSEVEE